jgi:hypothetical protein
MCKELDINYVEMEELIQTMITSFEKHIGKVDYNRDQCIRNIIQDTASMIEQSYKKDALCTQLIFAWFMFKFLPIYVFLAPPNPEQYPTSMHWCLASIQQNFNKQVKPSTSAPQNQA